LLRHYIEALEQTYQHETAELIRNLSAAVVLQTCFVKIVPQLSFISVDHSLEVIEADLGE
jgi:hypothetical protein